MIWMEFLGGLLDIEGYAHFHVPRKVALLVLMLPVISVVSPTDLGGITPSIHPFTVTKQDTVFMEIACFLLPSPP